MENILRNEGFQINNLEQNLNQLKEELRVINYIPHSTEDNVVSTTRMTKKGQTKRPTLKFNFLGTPNQPIVKIDRNLLVQNSALVFEIDNTLRVFYPKIYKDLLRWDLGDSTETISLNRDVIYHNAKEVLEIPKDTFSKGFMEDEYLGRKIISNTFPKTNFYFTTEKYATYDAQYWNDKGELILVEIKTRNFPSTKHNTAFIERAKMSKLIRTKEDMKGAKVIYLNIFTDGVVVIWNVEEYQKYPTHSIESKYQTRGNDNKVFKDFVKLPIDKAYKINSSYETSFFTKPFNLIF